MQSGSISELISWFDLSESFLKGATEALGDFTKGMFVSTCSLRARAATGREESQTALFIGIPGGGDHFLLSLGQGWVFLSSFIPEVCRVTSTACTATTFSPSTFCSAASSATILGFGCAAAPGPSIIQKIYSVGDSVIVCVGQRIRVSSESRFP